MLYPSPLLALQAARRPSRSASSRAEPSYMFVIIVIIMITVIVNWLSLLLLLLLSLSSLLLSFLLLLLLLITTIIIILLLLLSLLLLLLSASTPARGVCLRLRLCPRSVRPVTGWSVAQVSSLLRNLRVVRGRVCSGAHGRSAGARLASPAGITGFSSYALFRAAGLRRLDPEHV